MRCGIDSAIGAMLKRASGPNRNRRGPGETQAAPIGQEQKAYQVTGLAGESLLCQSERVTV